MTNAVKEREVRVLNNGATFMVRDGDSILDAALAQGIRLPHQCRGASCGECKSRLVKGAVDHGWALGFGITDAEKEAGMCLPCQAKPITDVVEIETLRPVGGVQIVETSARVVVNARVTPRVVRLVVAPNLPLHYEAGSYAELVLPGVGQNRVYSFATPPRADGLLEFFVALHPQGRASGYVHATLEVGDQVGIKAPFGSCRLPRGAGTVIGLAGGTGLAPVLAIFEQSLEGGAPHQHQLVFSVREDGEVYALDRLESLSRRFPNFSYTLLVTDAPSRFCERQMFAHQWLRENFQTLAGHRAVIGGSPGFVQACSETCRSLGMESSEMATDSFLPQQTSSGDKQ